MKIKKTVNGKHKWKNYFSLREISPIVRILTLSDIFIIGGASLMSPIFAIFIVENVKGGNIEIVGLAQMIFLATSSFLQIPIAVLIDKKRGEWDDFWFLLSGQILSALSIFAFLFINSVPQLLILQFFYGIGFALALPSWYAIFTRHIDSKHEGLEWGIYRTLIDAASAGAAVLGGIVAFQFGFKVLFVFVGVFTLIGALVTFNASKIIRKPRKII